MNLPPNATVDSRGQIRKLYQIANIYQRSEIYCLMKIQGPRPDIQSAELRNLFWEWKDHVSTPASP